MKIATVQGIGVYIHWTFWVLIAYYLIASTMEGGAAYGLFAVGLVLSIFACVVAHEFGHAAAAAKFGIRTADITLLPIGGVARLTRLPEKPHQELIIALAGPAVNVVIAAILMIPILLGAVASSIGASEVAIAGASLSFLDYLLAANVFLVIFNLLPAFPMDGGRVLRSLLAMRTDNLRATEIAARVGRWMALGFAILSFYLGFTLLLVAAFIFFAGTAELMAVRFRELGKQPGSAGGSPFRVQFPFGQPGGQGQFHGQWQTHVYPQQGTSFDWEHTNQHTAGELESDNVIDAIDVKRLPPNN